jgi:hypothetical protein
MWDAYVGSCFGGKDPEWVFTGVMTLLRIAQALARKKVRRSYIPSVIKKFTEDGRKGM